MAWLECICLHSDHPLSIQYGNVFGARHLAAQHGLDGGATTQQHPQSLVSGFGHVGFTQVIGQHFFKMKFARTGLQVGSKQLWIVVGHQIAHEAKEGVGVTKLRRAPALPIEEGGICVAIRRG